MKTFHLEVYTPERFFFDGEVEAITIEAPDGELTILADHAPLVSSVVSSAMKIRVDGEWREAFHSEGFLEVLGKNLVQVFAQACEWPEEINEERAHAAAIFAENEIRNSEYRAAKYSQLSLHRARERMKIRHHYDETHPKDAEK